VARTLRPGDGQYPARLAGIQRRPALLRVRGELGTRRAVAIVGTRNPDAYGGDMARELAAGAVRAGLTVVSGGALGVDAAAHRGALDAGGHTVVVLGTGVDVFFPAVNRPLFQAVLASGGALVSEQPDGTPGWKANFPARNRIIAALAEAVVVVQAKEKSGALITASWARSLGVPVLAVPGDARDPLSAGPIGLLRAGALVAAEAGDLLRVLGIEAAPPPQLELPALEGDENAVLATLGRRPRHADEVARAAGVSPGAALAALLALELRGLCEQRPGHLFVRRG
jgi:DNA processing protein